MSWVENSFAPVRRFVSASLALAVCPAPGSPVSRVLFSWPLIRFDTTDAEKTVFTCPLHACANCALGTGGSHSLIRCVRCPTAYHRMCTPAACEQVVRASLRVGAHVGARGHKWASYKKGCPLLLPLVLVGRVHQCGSPSPFAPYKGGPCAPLPEAL